MLDSASYPAAVSQEGNLYLGAPGHTQRAKMEPPTFASVAKGGQFVADCIIYRDSYIAYTLFTAGALIVGIALGIVLAWILRG